MPPLVAIFLVFPTGKDPDLVFGVFELPPPPLTHPEQVAAIRRATVGMMLDLAGRNLPPLKLPAGFLEAVDGAEHEKAIDLWKARAGHHTGYSRLPAISAMPTHDAVQRLLADFRAKGGGA